MSADALFTVDAHGHARIDDPGTSAAAAAALPKSIKQSTMMHRLLLVFARFPATAEEAAEIAGYGPGDGAWKRVSDLERKGLIEETGLTARGSSGREQRVMRITEAGKGLVG